MIKLNLPKTTTSKPIQSTFYHDINVFQLAFLKLTKVLIFCKNRKTQNLSYNNQTTIYPFPHKRPLSIAAVNHVYDENGTTLSLDTLLQQNTLNCVKP